MEKVYFPTDGGEFPVAYSTLCTDAKESLPPIGVFWDIENCQVPKNKSAVAIAQYIRSEYFKGHHEAEFMCVCDIHKENDIVIQELVNAQVTVVHVGCQSKNAADSKLRQSIRRFADIYSPPATVILISGDVNFATDLCDLRYRRKFNIIILHNGFATEPLLFCANWHDSFISIVAKVPIKTTNKQQSSKKQCDLCVSNLPTVYGVAQVRNRLNQLADNCGGKVINITGTLAQLRFPNADSTLRARKRMDNEDVFGNKISVSFPPNSNNGTNNECGAGRNASPQKQGRKNVHGYSSSPDQACQTSHNGHTPNKGQPPKNSFPPPSNATSLQQSHAAKSVAAADSIQFSRPWDRNPSLQNAFSMAGGQSEIFAAFSSKPQDQFQRPYGTHKMNGLGQASFCAGQKVASHGLTGLASSDCEMGRRRKKIGGWRSDGYGTSSSDDGQGNQRHRGLVGNLLEGGRKITGRRANNRFGATNEGRRDKFDGRSTCLGGRNAGHGVSSVSSFMPSSNRSTPSPQPYYWANWSNGTLASTMPGFAQLQQTKYPAAFTGSESQSDSAHSVESSHSNEPVELQITNLDQCIDAKEMKRYLQAIFREHVMVLHVSVNLSPDGSLTAGIKVPTIQDAQFAISQLHRRRIGSKRILISVLNPGDGPPLSVLRTEVCALLMDVPRNNLPLFKFRELYEKRYHRSIGVSELHKLHDVVSVQENSNGRIVSLNAGVRNIPSPAFSDGSKEVQEIFELAHCEIHCHNQDEGKGWAEKEQALQLPNVMISLKVLTPNVHSLLQLHANSIPLNSFPICYECEFGTLNTVDEDGASLEHLVTCIPGVHIVRGQSRIKKLEWIDENSSEHPEMRTISPPLASQLALFCREIVDLLKIHPYCRMPLSKFIPMYHNHFGKQCRVADYGHTRLVDLLESLPHVVQIIGEGTKRLLTLTHRAQIKRFTADLLRILKSQASKQILLSCFSEIYSKSIGKDFNVINYGVCDISDLLPEVSEGSVVITDVGSDTIISIPKREQTPEEADRTKQFASEAVELLRLSPRCCMAFTKFIPAYHHHFGKQCRVSDYGFTKLIELFEAIPETVEVQASRDEDEKILQLTQPEMLQVFANQIGSMMQAPGRQIMTLEKMLSAFIQMHGYSLHPEDFGASDVRELFNKISHVVKVVETSGGLIVTAVDRDHVLHQSICGRRILLDQPDGKMGMEDFMRSFKSRYGHKCMISQLCNDPKEFKVEGNGSYRTISVNPLQLLMKDVVLLLEENCGKMTLSQFEVIFNQRFRRPLVPAQYGFVSIYALLISMPEVVLIRGRKRTIHLNEDGPCYLALFKSAKMVQSVQNAEQKEASPSQQLNGATVDLMSDPIPSRIPSPALRPLPVHANANPELIRFDSPSPDCSDEFTFQSTSLPQQQTLQLSNLMDGHPEPAYYSMPSRSLSPYFPPPSMVPPVPVTWMYQAMPPTENRSERAPSVSPPTMAIAPVCRTPPAESGHDSSENEINTPPCIRELIAPSSAESTPSQPSARNRYKPRIAAQFSNPITPSS